MNILYFQHVGALGGSGRSLFELVRALKDKIDCNVIIACPKGQLHGLFKELGCQVVPVFGLCSFDNNQYSYYSGVRWFILFRELFLLFPTLFLFFQLKISHKNIDIIHINDITMPVVGVLAKLFFPKAVLVCHARCVQRTKRNFISRCLGLIGNWAYDIVICIDENVASSFPYDINRVIIHNGVPLPNLYWKGRCEKEVFRVGMVGSLNKSKGSFSYLRAIKVLRDRDAISDVEFLVFGAVPRTSEMSSVLLSAFNIQEDLYFKATDFILQNELEKCVRFLPHEEDLSVIYDTIDLVCFPSLLDAPGRPIFEAGVFGKPSIACISVPRDDTFLPNETGLLVEPNDELSLALAIEAYVKNVDLYNSHSQRAYQFYRKKFDIQLCARLTADVYCRLLNDKRSI
jgi:glycosyltransferase involved in cell wall biosynthesis